MRRRQLDSWICSSLVLLMLLPTAIWAQADTPSQVFVEKVDVSVVNVEVFVTDKKGEAVVGLTQDDFVVMQDGQPVEITNFFAATRPDRWAEVQATDLQRLREAAPPTDVPANQQLHLVVYVDHFNLRAPNRKRVLDNLAGFLEKRAYDGDNIMLMGYNGSLDVVQPFTRDYIQIQDGLSALGKVATHQQNDDGRAAAGPAVVERRRHARQPWRDRFRVGLERGSAVRPESSIRSAAVRQSVARGDALDGGLARTQGDPLRQ